MCRIYTTGTKMQSDKEGALVMLRILLWIIHIPNMVVDIIRLNRSRKRYMEYVEKPFACPNCGAVFYAKWYHLRRLREASLVMIGKAKLKCPHCKQWDMCTWKGE